MLSHEVTTELEHTGAAPKQLSSVSFTEDSLLWRKEKHFCGFQNHELTAHRYEYLKTGKIFGFETHRFVSQYQGHLFYFNVLPFSFRTTKNQLTISVFVT
jgi:hypothetical protein